MNPKTKAYPWTSADVDMDRIVKAAKAMMALPVKYGFGSKAKSMETPPESFLGANPDGKLTRRVDCSGFVRYVLYPDLKIPDGSWNQREWFANQAFKPCAKADLGNKDGRVRVAFLKPSDTPSGIGHVVLLYNGMTYESHGGVGVDSRAWGSADWMKKCTGFVIDPRQR